MIEPVYPKEDPEYRKVIMERFIQLVKNTRWIDDNEYQGKKRGRKPKKSTRIDSVPRSEGEANAVGKKYFFNLQ